MEEIHEFNMLRKGIVAFTAHDQYVSPKRTHYPVFGTSFV